MEKVSNKVVIVNEKSNLIAAILSFLIPGMGQMYLGSVLLGIVWLLFTIVSWGFFFWFPVIPLGMHLVAIIDAAIRRGQ
tara:strand:+ start:394 stop:630 length:237 start_codon:yes stop_codon:yes gene_type:complete